MHKPIASIAVMFALSGCGGEGITTDSVPKFKDHRANYEVDGIDLLHRSITDTISDDLLGFEAENLSRKVTYTLDRLSLNILRDFNVSTLAELEALVPNVGDNKTSLIFEFHLMRLTPEMVMVSSSNEIEHFFYEADIIETRFGISTYKFTEAPTRVDMLVYPEGIAIEAFNQGYQAEYDASKGTYKVRLQYDENGEKSQYDELIVDLNSDQVRLEIGTTTMEGLEVKDTVEQSHRFEYNRKQNTLSRQ